MSSLKGMTLLKGLNIGAFLVTVLVNALANTLALNGRTTGEISDLYPNLFVPAGYVFSIWGLIYTLLLIFVVYQALPTQNEKDFLQKISYLFLLSSIANVSWLFLWHYEKIVLSNVPMFILLTTLIAIYLRLDIGRSDVSLKDKLFVHLPFSVYLGWITVAPIANVAAALTAMNWDGWGISQSMWTVSVIIIASIITIAVIATRKDVAYSLVIVWALMGIIVKQIGNQSIVLTASISIVVIVTALVMTRIRTTNRR